MRTRTNRAVVRTLTNGLGPLHHHGNLGGMKPLCGALNVTPRETYAAASVRQIGRRCHTIALI
jgi:hypothetical protein